MVDGHLCVPGLAHTVQEGVSSRGRVVTTSLSSPPWLLAAPPVWEENEQAHSIWEYSIVTW